MLSFPNAKINLGLQITGKLPNGYHTINSCLYPVPWCDALEFLEAKKTSFESTGIPIPGSEKNNLVLKAYRLLKKDMPLPELSIHLHKVIPMGAGLGGGSADASFMLKTLNDHYQLFLEDSFLEDYASQLGSDCPFFIQNRAAIATGTGTELSPLDLSLKGLHIVIINPGIHISTQAAYAGVTPKPATTDIEELLLSKDFNRWKSELVNDFEAGLFNQHPILGQLKNELYEAGALYASMSGSGSTMFGIFEEKVSLKPEWQRMQSKQFVLN